MYWRLAEIAGLTHRNPMKRSGSSPCVPPLPLNPRKRTVDTIYSKVLMFGVEDLICHATARMPHT